MEIPAVVSLTENDIYLISKQRDLVATTQDSAFFIKQTSANQVGFHAAQRYRA
jgi:hypothetical protein